ncbi:hypothetical protein DFH07DRAFT_795956 [Mycena maculata]|uniref:Uncharacterized protein n=1 Tax=Mycena maculata TaxID=230809 RepID=A0AAD7K5W2_9AGAR|nr:hypothetical protein DFH07DRAFT_795956 [Mycena maculata]
MAVATDTLINAASRAYSPNSPIIVEEIRHRLEWAWGLEYGSLDQHLADFVDPHLVEISTDDTLVLIAPSDLLKELFLVTADLPSSSSKSRVFIQDLYQGHESFEYLVLPVDPASQVLPRVVFSPIPPHLTICSSVGKILKRWGYNRVEFNAIRDSFITLVKTSPPTGATFTPDIDTFIRLRYVHQSWSTCYVPPRFLGLEGPDESDEDAASSTMEWEIDTIEDEPQRRLLPHESQRDPVLKIGPLPHDDDDASQENYITGVEDPEEYAKVSLARGDYDRTWLKGVEQWVQGASVVVDDQMLLNDGQIEEDSREQPRVATSLDLDRPDYLSRRQARTTT